MFQSWFSRWYLNKWLAVIPWTSHVLLNAIGTTLTLYNPPESTTQWKQSLANKCKNPEYKPTTFGHFWTHSCRLVSACHQRYRGTGWWGYSRRSRWAFHWQDSHTPPHTAEIVRSPGLWRCLHTSLYTHWDTAGTPVLLCRANLQVQDKFVKHWCPRQQLHVKYKLTILESRSLSRSNH